MSHQIEIIEPDHRDRIRKIGFVHFMSISTFAASMGYCGLCFGWRAAHQIWGVPACIGEVFGLLAVVIYICVSIQYSRKIHRDEASVLAEWHSSSKVNFFGTFTVSTALLAAVLAPYSHFIASIFWWAALAMIILFGWAILSHWLLEPQHVNEVTPAWLLPVLGPITIPIAGNILQNPGYHDISIFCTSVGIMTGIPVIALLLARSIIGRPLADTVQPSLMILMAPFGMGYITYSDTFGPDNFATLFICDGMFLFVPIVCKIASVMLRAPFCMGWWSVSFPSMAFTNGVLKFSNDYTVFWTRGLGLLLLICGTCLIVWLSFKTLQAVIHKTLWKLY